MMKYSFIMFLDHGLGFWLATAAARATDAALISVPVPAWEGTTGFSSSTSEVLSFSSWTLMIVRLSGPDA